MTRSSCDPKNADGFLSIIEGSGVEVMTDLRSEFNWLLLSAACFDKAFLRTDPLATEVLSMVLSNASRLDSTSLIVSSFAKLGTTVSVTDFSPVPSSFDSVLGSTAVTTSGTGNSGTISMKLQNGMLGFSVSVLIISL